MTRRTAGTDWEASSGDPGSTSTSLIERVKAGDAKGWERFIDLYGPLVYQWCRQCGLQAADAADVGQEVFKSVAINAAGFRRERPGDSLRGWLWTITHNKIRDHLKSFRAKPIAQGGTAAKQRFEEVPEHLSDSSINGQTGSDHGLLEHRITELARASVEERTWEAFWRITVEGRPVALVADELEMTPAAVYKAKYRVLRLVRSQIADLE
jgi:RNA polymerase sigma-70 factor (ECF subfamily)